MAGVGPLTNTLAQALYKEKVRDVIPALYEADVSFCNMIEKREAERIGPRGMRIPKKLRPAGLVRTWEPDGGDLGRGSGAQYEYAQVTTLPLLVAFESSRAAQWNTQSSDIAAKNAVQDMLKDATNEYKAQYDRYLFGDSTGVMGTVASGGTGTTPVFTSPIGTRWLRAGQKYTVYPTGLGAPLGTVAVESVDAPNRQITITATVGGTSSSGDKYLPEGCLGASPTWIYGTAYHVSSSASGLWMGMARASFPQIRSIQVDAGSGALVPAHFRLVKNRLSLFRDQAFGKGRWLWVWSPAQRHAYEDLAQLVNVIQKQSNERKGIDMLYNPDQFEVDGMATFASSNQNPSRIDLLNLDTWFRVETVPLGMYSVDEVSTFPIYGASGGIAASEVSYLASMTQVCVDDPGLNAYISSLALPVGYSEFGT